MHDRGKTKPAGSEDSDDEGIEICIVSFKLKHKYVI